MLSLNGVSNVFVSNANNFAISLYTFPTEKAGSLFRYTILLSRPWTGQVLTLQRAGLK
jgi:hypothetical protein